MPTTARTGQSPAERDVAKDLADLVALWRELKPLPEVARSHEEDLAAKLLEMKELEKTPPKSSKEAAARFLKLKELEKPIEDWPTNLERLAKIEGVDARVCDLIVREASVDLCIPHEQKNKDLDAKIYGLLNKIVRRTPGGDTDLERTPQWKQILFAWRFGAEMEKLMAAGDSKVDATRKRYFQAAVEHWCEQAIQATDELKTAGTLDAGEAILLRVEARYRAERRHYLVNNNPREVSGPTDSAETSLLRIMVEIPAYRRLLRINKVRLEVRALVFETFRNDCRIIGDPKRVARLSEPDRKEAQAVSKEANEILSQIERAAASQPASATKPGEPVDYDP